VIIAEVAGGTLNSSAANFNTAVKGVASGTLNTLNGNLGSDVSVILNVTLEAAISNKITRAMKLIGVLFPSVDLINFYKLMLFVANIYVLTGVFNFRTNN
jgi:hypothetical protein